MEKFLNAMDHPIPFLLFMLLALWGLAALLTYGFKKAGMPGPAAFFQHP
jgi:asparagine N-glycosylation enzyme membrane subunit Stt3